VEERPDEVEEGDTEEDGGTEFLQGNVVPAFILFFRFISVPWYRHMCNSDFAKKRTNAKVLRTSSFLDRYCSYILFVLFFILNLQQLRLLFYYSNTCI